MNDSPRQSKEWFCYAPEEALAAILKGVAEGELTPG
jgi:hypothetical protein